jgi:PEP-CTERM motif
MKNILRNTIAATLLLAGVIQHASADIVTVTGDTTNGPTFTPPAFWGGPPDPANTGVAYQAFDVVTAEGPNPFNWENSFLTSCEYACVTFLYSEAGFDPNDGMKNLMTVASNIYHFSAMQTFLEPGKHYTFVVTGYSAEDAGAFSITGGSTGGISISPVPEPSAGLMLLGGLAGIGALARRRARRAAQLA